jgi:hypothetical protein
MKLGKQGVPAENLKGFDNGRFTVLRRTSATTKMHGTHWVIACNKCGAEKIAVKSRIVNDGVMCECQSRTGNQGPNRRTKNRDWASEAMQMLQAAIDALNASDTVSGWRLAQKAEYLLKRANKSS